MARMIPPTAGGTREKFGREKCTFEEELKALGERIPCEIQVALHRGACASPYAEVHLSPTLRWQPAKPSCIDVLSRIMRICANYSLWLDITNVAIVYSSLWMLLAEICDVGTCRDMHGRYAVKSRMRTVHSKSSGIVFFFCNFSYYLYFSTVGKLIPNRSLPRAQPYFDILDNIPHLTFDRSSIAINNLHRAMIKRVRCRSSLR
jgi:hypothetical protein